MRKFEIFPPGLNISKNNKMKEIEKEDIERLAEFEETILNLQTDSDSPKYSIDYEMESQVKYDVLIDSFGVSEVSNAIKEFGIDKIDLSHHQTFIEIFNHLKNKGE